MAANDLPRSAAHPFYTRLNQILDQHDFEGYVEGLCQRFYADEGRPGLPPGRYFRLLLIRYVEGLDAERAIAWRGPIRLGCVTSIGHRCELRPRWIGFLGAVENEASGQAGRECHRQLEARHVSGADRDLHDTGGTDGRVLVTSRHGPKPVQPFQHRRYREVSATVSLGGIGQLGPWT